ncbi:MAG: putative ATPase subunit of terminase (gpP-like) [Flavipsychrobacter sp.]|jgi:predicted transcriptional regulator|nr:putative ATPase subunit of terminase (gpP-like) [Flavipsychrobacter sp.]
MSNSKKLKAKELYLQTGLSKTQIAGILGISRRCLHYWIRQDNWIRLKQSAEHMPSLMAEKCYYLFHHLTDNYLADYRAKHLTRENIETLYRLTLTIKNLKNRTTINESMEMFALFQDGLQKHNPELAKAITPYVEKYLTNRSSVSAYHLTPGNFTKDAFVEPPEENI